MKIRHNWVSDLKLIIEICISDENIKLSEVLTAASAIFGEFSDLICVFNK